MRFGHPTYESRDEHTMQLKLEAEQSSFSSTIPVLDMKDFYDRHHHSVFVNGLRSAFEKFGFAGIVNTPINEQMLTEVYQGAKLFFELDDSQKKEITSTTNSGERGYVGTSESPVGKEIKIKDKKEFVHFGRELEPEQQKRLGYPQNIWPTQVNLKTPVITLSNNFADLVHPISVAIEEAIGAPPTYLQKMLAEGDHLFRIIKYPQTLKVKEEGAAPHTDSNFFTLLPPATSKGLEVQLNGEWQPVVVPPNAVIINGGSMLENMTNGLFQAAVHRVVKYEDVGDRYAIAFFVHSREDDPMTPLPSCIEQTGGVQKYPEATRQELLDQRLIAMGRATKDKIDKFAASGLIERWKNFLGEKDPRTGLRTELEKVSKVLKEHKAPKL